VEGLLPQCQDELKKAWGRETSIKVDGQNFLPPDSTGGIVLLAKEGKIRVISTLESRLEAISHKMVPEIRTTLFGRNPNRRFLD
jgi:V-type H+-transporting ATPase subunit E